MNPFAMGLLGDLFSVSADSGPARSTSAIVSAKLPVPGRPARDVNLVKVVVNVNWK
ncbi:hypothetical protein [Novosphingobium panipatense]|uniref:Uncharacterized protein n=1 Tax=Novosphingobium panipatense TaxID=428991 RepID=A0ABY1Q279_9SPHN|nr:hypothetical protein [Novosphingobium panipatense]SMP53664.1 hypothetical protein SAMN06296065_101456 [Novosphingobium panipatense]